MKEKAYDHAPVSFGTNLGLVLEYFDMYLEDPDSVSEEMQILFETILQNEGQISSPKTGGSNSKLENIIKWAMDIRTYGHLVADVYPVYPPEVKNKPDFSFESYGFTEEDVKNVDVETISPYLVDTFDNEIGRASSREGGRVGG